LRGEGQAGKRRTGRVGVRARAPLVLLIAALALLAQWFVAPLREMRANAPISQVAAELKATFGDAAVLCLQADADGSLPAHDPQNHCDDHCPLCQLHAGVMALWPPAQALPAMRVEIVADIRGPPSTPIPTKSFGAASAQPRAPPSEA